MSTSRIEDWEALTPLSAKQKASVALLQEIASSRSVPPHLLKTNAVGLTNGALNPFPRSSTPVLGSASSLLRKIESKVDVSLTPPRAASPRFRTGSQQNKSSQQHGPIESIAQFQDWYSSHIETAIENEQLHGAMQYLDSIQSFASSCQEILDGLQNLQGFLKELEANYKFVEENSRVLQSACEEMLQEQKHLIEVSEAITARLDYFRELEKATKHLNAPGEAIVLDPDFLNLVDRLDICLDFFKANRAFKDAEIYIIRFQQCLTRSMTLIKIHFHHQITNTTREAVEKLANKKLGETAVNALVYTKYSTQAEELRLLLFELEKRAEEDANEYGSLLEECFSTWFSARNALLAESISEEVKRMDPYTADLVKLARTGCSYLRTVCSSEWSLFGQFFSQNGEGHIYNFLETLCDYFYDFLRPRVLHESSLEKLSEFCTVIQAMMALDPSNDVDQEDLEGLDPPETPLGLLSPATPRSSYFGKQMANGGPMTSTPTRSSSSNLRTNRALAPLRFARLLLPVLQDAQTRMVFRAQAIIQSDVFHYLPSDKDLDYPNILTKSKRLSVWMNGTDPASWADRGQTLESRLPSSEIQESWYPTLTRTLWVLAKLHTKINNTIFEDFAGEAVNLCRQSLSSAAARIAQKSQYTEMESQLFTIRHFLILKEMVASVDLIQIERAADFSTVTDALSNLIWSGSALLNPSTLFETVSRSLPNFAETMKDAKTDLDTALKAVCEDFIVKAALVVAAPLAAFTSKARTYKSQKTTNDAPLDLATQEFAAPSNVQALHDQFIASEGMLESGLKDLFQKLNLWLSDKRTISALINPICEEVAESYNDFSSLVKSDYEFEVSSRLISASALRDRIRTLVEQQGGQVIVKK